MSIVLNQLDFERALKKVEDEAEGISDDVYDSLYEAIQELSAEYNGWLKPNIEDLMERVDE